MSSVNTGRNSSIAGEMYCLHSNGRRSETSARAVRPRSVPKCSNVIIADIKRLPIDRAATAIAPSATAGHEMSGSVIGPRRFYRFRIATWSSRCLMNSLRWHFKTRGSFMDFCFVLWPNPFSRWPPIRNGWEPGLVFSLSCTPGPNGLNRTLTHDAWHYHLLHFH